MTQANDATGLGAETSDLRQPASEAKFFYAAFQQGWSAEEIRGYIEVPDSVKAEWYRKSEGNQKLRTAREQMVEYRHRVLTLFDALVSKG
jgi:hypothetical protein